MSSSRISSDINSGTYYEAGRGMQNVRDGFCKPVAYVLCVTQYSVQAQNRADEITEARRGMR